MIRTIDLKNFKCFEQESLRVRPLTVITGGNAAGKSSIIQAMLLLAQSKQDIQSNGRLRLDDKLINLVSLDQVRYARSESADIRIAIYDDLLEDDVELSIPDALKADKQPACEYSDNFPEAISKSALFQDDFVYLNANRLTPRNEYLKGNDERFDSRLGDSSGHRTVFRLQEALDNNETVGIEALRLNNKPGVAANLNEWMTDILGMSVSVSADGNPSEGKAKLMFSTPSTGPVQALNMAFGNTYILPIILGVLTATPGSLLIVENPEAHLHPKAQFRIGRFLAIAAQGGMQIIVETHSDHLLNGIRVAAKNGLIEATNVSLNFIEQDEDQHSVTEIELHDDGSLDKWPPGFFDEWENALKEIIS
ncbi:MAG: DUF3696 domain-containing protein [Muribaculaceae bacterium]|nr:DUF3696 domain-containing protein [Muribaculaceae bacterium]